MIEKETFGSRVFDIFNIAILLGLSFITLYPFMYVVFASFSDSNALTGYVGLLWKPLGFSLNAYNAVIEYKDIWIGYRNTLFYVVVGTSLNLLATSVGAYVLAHNDFYWNRLLTTMVLITMFFGGGLIPNFLLINGLGLYDTVLALIIPNLISAWNLFIMRTNFKQIPISLEESAKIDGANDFTVLFKIILPLSLPILAVMTLYYGVAHWNSWFNALIYLRRRSIFPLQLFLRELLLANKVTDMTVNVIDSDRNSVSETIQFAAIIVSTLPIILAYPFLQRYFVKGVMIGAVKG